MSTETEEKPGIEEAKEVNQETDIIIIDDIDDGSPEPDENTGEKAAEEAGEKEKKTPQEKINETINKKHRQMREAEEKAEKVQVEKDELQAKLDEINKKEPPIVPDMPDRYDEQYDQLMIDRDLAIQKQAHYDVNQQTAVQNQQNTLNEQAAKKDQETRNNIKSYSDRSKELGLDEVSQMEADKVVGSYIPNQDVKDYLLQDKNGPLMVKYLSENPIELDKLSAMSSMNAAVYLSVVSSEAVKLKPKQTKTPTPLDIPGGRSAPKVADPHLEGVEFE